MRIFVTLDDNDRKDIMEFWKEHKEMDYATAKINYLHTHFDIYTDEFYEAAADAFVNE